MFSRLCIVILCSALWVDSAFAHARLTKSTPDNKAKLTAAPAQVELWFNELLDEGFNTVEVYPATELNAKSHSNLIKGEPVVDKKSRNHLTVSLRPLVPGEYIVDYRVLSRDGHTAPGRFTFQLLEAR